jgi:Trk-type K+ transport system membrane component
MTSPRTQTLGPARIALRIAAVAAFACLVLEFGFPIDRNVLRWMHAAELAVVVAYVAYAGISWWRARDRGHKLRERWIEVVLIALVGIDVVLALAFERNELITSTWFLGIQLYFVVRVLFGLWTAQSWLVRLRLRPAALLFCSFVGLALLGAVALRFPLSRAEGAAEWNFTDALFTAASAVSVTGLGVRDVGTELSFRGQIVLLTLIQIGGLGLVTLACGAGLVQRGLTSVREVHFVTQALGITAPGRLRRFLAFTFISTLLCELAGAVWLWFQVRHTDLGAHDPIWWSVFHSVSAFCNAGFSLSSQGFVPYAGQAGVLLPIAALIVVGGLGFGVWIELFDQRPLSFDTWRWIRWRLSEAWWWPFPNVVFDTPVKAPISLNSRLVLASTALLLVGGTLVVSLAESGRGATGDGAGERWLSAAFHAASARTAGFHAVDLTALAGHTLFFLMILMVIGASPLSTGGGLRTTTFATALLAVRAMVRGRERAEAFGRSIGVSVVHACIAISVLYLIGLTVVTAALLWTQDGLELRGALFESISALSTVGWTLGVTPTLDPTGRWILSAAMIAGRIGPLAVLWSLVSRTHPLRYRYPEEPVVIG